MMALLVVAGLCCSLGLMLLATAMNNERGADAANAVMLGFVLTLIGVVLLVVAGLKWIAG